MTDIQRQQMELNMSYYAKRAEGKKKSVFRDRIEEYTRGLVMTGYAVTWNGNECTIRREN